MIDLTLHDLKNLEKYVDVLYRKLESLEDVVDDMHAEQNERIRIPHRCPVCNGTTYDDKEGAQCIPCEGKGIVWG
jgi:DnaJ-class molecular chaperone